MRMVVQGAGIMTCTKKFAGCDPSVPLHPSSVPVKMMSELREEAATSVKEGRERTGSKNEG